MCRTKLNCLIEIVLIALANSTMSPQWGWPQGNSLLLSCHLSACMNCKGWGFYFFQSKQWVHPLPHTEQKPMEVGALLGNYTRVCDVPLNIPDYGHTENYKTQVIEFRDFLGSHQSFRRDKLRMTLLKYYSKCTFLEI